MLLTSDELADRRILLQTGKDVPPSVVVNGNTPLLLVHMRLPWSPASVVDKPTI